MNKSPILIAVAAAFTAVGLSTSAHAQLISSESFWTVNAAPTNGEYRQGSIANPNISSYNNTIVVAGNTGFNTTQAWQGNTSGLQVTTDLSLTHNGLVGTSQPGSLRWVPFADGTDRTSHRRLASPPPASSSYFLSGLIRGTTPAADGKLGAAGFGGPNPGTSSLNLSNGFHMGLHTVSGTLRLAAFANNTTYDLLTLTTPQLTTTFQVVLRLDVDASGNDTLTAWYAPDGATGLTLGLAATNVGNVWSTVQNSEWFVTQVRGGGASSQLLGTFDEMRFGTTLGSVTAIPEPSTWALLAGSLAALVIFRRRRCGQAG